MNENLKLRKTIRLPFNLNCASVSKFYYKGTNNGLVGPSIKVPSDKERLSTMYNVRRGTRTIRHGIARLGAGTQGVAYLACTSPSCKRNIVIKVSPFDKTFTAAKQPAHIEYSIQKAIFKVIPRHVPAVYKIVECPDFVSPSSFANRKNKYFDYSKQFVIFSEYGRGGDLKTWMRKMFSRLRDDDIARMIRQIVESLRNVTKKYPEFRHNDLHLGNIFVDDSKSAPRLMIADFGLARIKAIGSNPLVNSNAHRGYGITSHTDIKYDTHLFLNSLYAEFHDRSFQFPQTCNFLKRMLPSGYYGREGTHIHEFRIRDHAPTRVLPTYTQILQDPFINKTARSISPRSISSPKVTVGKSPSTPKTNAAELARNALRGVPGVSISTTGTKPPASEFLRMSPRSRAQYMTKHRGTNTSRTIMTRNVVAKTGKVRVTARRVPVQSKYLKINRTSGNNATRRKTTSMNRSPGVKTNVSSGSSPSHPSRSVNFEPYRAPNTYKERSRVVRGVKKVIKERKSTPIRPAKQILNRYVNSLSSPMKVRPSNLKTYLTRRGFSNAQANRESKNWIEKWVTNRGNPNAAFCNLKAGKNNLARRGYIPNAITLARKRFNMNLSRGANGRIRQGKTLFATKKKDELVALARRYGIRGAENMSKDRIVSALYG